MPRLMLISLISAILSVIFLFLGKIDGVYFFTASSMAALIISSAIMDVVDKIKVIK